MRVARLRKLKGADIFHPHQHVWSVSVDVDEFLVAARVSSARGLCDAITAAIAQRRCCCIISPTRRRNLPQLASDASISAEATVVVVVVVFVVVVVILAEETRYGATILQCVAGLGGTTFSSAACRAQSPAAKTCVDRTKGAAAIA